ncbi:TetR/AcrR family transcriptional regulator [Amycolatopsis sp. CA-230715]|uniref:TetR/AcrR family transcriptional regulator n=1 Tax=Amycolatopsis sp. CA-230715 TaxID=2745196 RepID=UPI001C034532|nr:TetR/AcrR family transcriptional regulator [Amycolatopsis sp. CA-230715]QWF76675.1 hypothetical protein HUW46_00051 [Amycolatopsis sp. CA-230715]
MDPTKRPRRADSRRNYERLLSVADAAFAERGTSAPLEGIARESGVAIGTLYGHFPTRLALIDALLHERNEALFAEGERLRAQEPPGEALEAWIRAAVDHAAIYQGLAALLVAGIDDRASDLHDACRRMESIGGRIAAGASEAGAVRRGVTAADVSTVISAVAWVREQVSPAQADRLLATALAGLRQAS